MATLDRKLRDLDRRADAARRLAAARAAPPRPAGPELHELSDGLAAAVLATAAVVARLEGAAVTLSADDDPGRAVRVWWTPGGAAVAVGAAAAGGDAPPPPPPPPSPRASVEGTGRVVESPARALASLLRRDPAALRHGMDT